MEKFARPETLSLLHAWVAEAQVAPWQRVAEKTVEGMKVPRGDGMIKRMSFPRGRHGFSKAEIMIVIVIMGLSLAIVAPKLSGVVGVSAIDGALNQVSGDLQFARLLAIKNGWPVSLATTTDGTYTIVEDPTGANRTLKTVALRRDYPGISLTAANITYDSRGMVTSGDAEVTASRQGRSGTLRVTGVGRINRD
jgi:Tfp pilus assembly protein FimT